MTKKTTTIPTYAEKRKEAGLGSGFTDHGDLETVKVAALCDDELAFVIYATQEIDSQFEEGGTVWLTIVGDEGGPTHKVWINQQALRRQLEEMVENDFLPNATKIIKIKGKNGREYYSFEQ